MKITLKMKQRHVPILHEFLSHIGFPGKPDKEEKSRKSIFEQVYMKVAKKSLQVQINRGDKDIKVQLHYHEAFELEKRLADDRHFTFGSYQYHTIRTIRDQLNQKLA